MTSPATIELEAFYSQSEVKHFYGISNRSIRDACRAGELRNTQQFGRRFFRGRWLIEWLEGQVRELEAKIECLEWLEGLEAKVECLDAKQARRE